MLNIENIKKGLHSTDQRPVVVWEGPGDNKNLGSNFRVVLTKKNSLVIEIQSGKSAMEQPIWVKSGVV